jgi:hypothetical protein
MSANPVSMVCSMLIGLSDNRGMRDMTRGAMLHRLICHQTQTIRFFGLLRDHASITPSVIAIMNGLLAVYSTNYPFEAPGTKLAFIVIIGSLL